MYAVVFELDTDLLSKSYPSASWNDAYGDIRRVLERHGFTWQQGSVYFGGEQVNAVTCVLAVMDCTRSLPWFGASVRDIRMLRIEEFNDLMPAVQQALGKG
jgi:virulence-associated protein VapD